MSSAGRPSRRDGEGRQESRAMSSAGRPSRRDGEGRQEPGPIGPNPQPVDGSEFLGAICTVTSEERSKAKEQVLLRSVIPITELEVKYTPSVGNVRL